jgi:hypothetical protein
MARKATKRKTLRGDFSKLADALKQMTAEAEANDERREDNRSSDSDHRIRSVPATN